LALAGLARNAEKMIRLLAVKKRKKQKPRKLKPKKLTKQLK
jgi:hypothetical protein